MKDPAEEAKELVLKYVRGTDPEQYIAKRPEWWRGIGSFNLEGVNCIKINIRSKEDETEAWDLVVEALQGRDDLRSSVKFLFDPVGDIVAQEVPLTHDEALAQTPVPFKDNALFKAGFEAGWEACWRSK